MLDRVSEQQTTGPGAGADAQAVDQLRLQIEAHEKEDASRSALKRVVGSVSSVFVKDDTSLQELKDSYRQQQQNLKDGKAVDTAEIQTLIKKDRDATETQSEVVQYGSQFLKTAGLFMRGRFGLAGTVGLYALDQIRPGDSFKDQLIDATLGAAKGGLMKGTFALMGEKPVGIAAKGVGLGVSSRILDLGLTRQTYLDPTTGEFSLSKGLTDTLHGSLNKTALATDVVVFGAAHGLLRGANSATLGRIDKSPFLTTIFTGTTFGLSSGATSEIMRQNAAGEQFDLSKIVKRSLIQGALDTAAAAPGGVQADPNVQGRLRNMTRSGLDNIRAQVDGVKTSLINFADSIPLNGGLVPALEGAPGVRLDVPTFRPEPTRKPARELNVNQPMAMMDGATGSGANLDSLLGSPPKQPAEARSGDTSTSVPAGERSLLGDRNVEVNSAVRVRTEAEKVGFQRFEDLAQAAARAEGGAQGKQALFQFLRQHPELEIPIKQYEGMLFDSVTTGYKPGELTQAEMKQRMDIVSMLGEFYKPDRARIFVNSREQAQALGEVRQILRGLKAEGAVAVIARQGLFDYLNQHPEVHEVVRRYAASSNDAREVAVLDQYFGTNHSAGLRDYLAWRANPLAQPAVAGSDSPAKAPESVIRAERPKEIIIGPGETMDADGTVRPMTKAELEARDAASREFALKQDLERYRRYSDLSEQARQQFEQRMAQLNGKSEQEALAALGDAGRPHGMVAALGLERSQEIVREWLRTGDWTKQPEDARLVLESLLTRDELVAVATWRNLGQDIRTGWQIEPTTGQPMAANTAGGERTTALPTGDGRQETGSALAAAGRAKPVSLVADGQGASQYAAVAPAPERKDATAAPPPERRAVSAPEAARQTVSASDLAKGLADPSPAVRNKTVRILADHLDKLTDAEFLAWKSAAPDAILLGSTLNRPDIASLPPAILKRFLSKQAGSAEKAPPEWAAEHVERARVAAEQRAAASDRPPRPPREKKDTIEMRIDLLEKALKTFADSPETAQRLVQLGAQDRGALENVMFSLGHPKFGEAYKSLLKQVIPHVESADAVKHLFQFIKQGDTDGAFAALQQMKPRPQGSVEEIERQLQAERAAQPAKTFEQFLDEATADLMERDGSADATKVVLEAEERLQAQEQAQQADLKPEAEKKFKDQEKQAGQQWEAMQRLVHDIMTGNIQAPRQPFGGRGPGGGDRRGGRGPGGGFGGGNR